MLEVEWEEVQTLLWGGKATPKVLLLFTTRIYLGSETHLMETAEPLPFLMSIIQTQNGDESAVLPESEIAQEDDGNECQDSNFVNTDENDEIESDEDHVPYRYMLVREIVEHCKTRGLTLPTTLRQDKLVHLLEQNDTQERTRRRVMREIEKMQRGEAESMNVRSSVTGPSSGTSDLWIKGAMIQLSRPAALHPKRSGGFQNRYVLVREPLATFSLAQALCTWTLTPRVLSARLSFPLGRPVWKDCVNLKEQVILEKRLKQNLGLPWR